MHRRCKSATIGGPLFHTLGEFGRALFDTDSRRFRQLFDFRPAFTDDPLEFFRAVRTFDSANQKLDDLICASIGAKLGDYEMSNLISVGADEVKIPEMERQIS